MCHRLTDGEIGHARLGDNDAVVEVDLSDALEFAHAKQHGISELDAAFRVAEKIDRARGIEPLALDTLA